MFLRRTASTETYTQLFDSWVDRIRKGKVRSLKTKLSLGPGGVALVITEVTYVSLSIAAGKTASAEAQQRPGEIVNYFSAAVSVSLRREDRVE